METQHHARGFEPPVLVGQSPAFRDLVGRLREVARVRRTTLISGPTGAGKDVVARSLHAYSDRRDRPYVTVHCGAMPEQLIEAEMFGHSRGAFTGAIQSRGGLVRSASGGTLFLDEIDSLPASAQAKLLRFLETGEYRAVGSDQLEHSDAWVIAATNQDLAERVRGGAFRADLMYRLAVVELPVPPLRARPDDIAELAQHFLSQIDANKHFDEEALRAMQSYLWPGNVRELKHRVESAALFSEAPTITKRALALAPSGLGADAGAGHRRVRAAAGAGGAARGEQQPHARRGPAGHPRPHHLQEAERRSLNDAARCPLEHARACTQNATWPPDGYTIWHEVR
jgi:DNA-binding NtrC family response regulator